jgi:fluoroacetyl-CoA thioesterase
MKVMAGYGVPWCNERSGLRMGAPNPPYDDSGARMKDSLRPGASLTKRIVIDRDRTIAFMGEEARVYATPRLVSDIEMTCRELLMAHSEEGEDSVGAEIALKHSAPTLAGSTVEITARVTAVEGRKVVLEVAARDEVEAVSSATHTRFVVDLARRIERLKAKAAKLEVLRR